MAFDQSAIKTEFEEQNENSASSTAICFTSNSVFDGKPVISVDQQNFPQQTLAACVVQQPRDLNLEKQMLETQHKICEEQKMLEDRLAELRRAKKALMFKRKQMFKNANGKFF